MGGHVHVYEASIIWRANRGQGTSAHKNYDRDHVPRVAGKPQLPMSTGLPRRPGEIQSRRIARRRDFVLPYAVVFAPLRGVSRGRRASGRLIVSTEDGGHFESVTLRPNVTIEAGEMEAARRLHEGAYKKCFIASSVNFPVFLEATILRAPLG
jgi:hypothetical protein